MNHLSVSHLWTQDLLYADSCSFLGISPDQHIFVEEFYGENWFAQHHLDADGQICASVDEQYGQQDADALDLPAGTLSAQMPPHDHPLNLPLLREWGMRAEDRVMEWVQPLTIAEKLALIALLSLNISPMQLLGLAESRVLAQADLNERQSLICRRLRLLVALPQVRRHASGLPYDYETIPCSVLHLWDRQTQEPATLENILPALGGIPLIHTLDFLVYAGRLYLAQGGTSDQPNKVHCWQIDAIT
jgi:hypothetical protein